MRSPEEDLCGAIHGRETERSLSGRVQWHPAQLLLQGWSVQAALRLSCPRHGGRLSPPHCSALCMRSEKGFLEWALGGGRSAVASLVPDHPPTPLSRPQAPEAQGQGQFRRGSRGLSWVWGVAGLMFPHLDNACRDRESQRPLEGPSEQGTLRVATGRAARSGASLTRKPMDTGQAESAGFWFPEIWN